VAMRWDVVLLGATVVLLLVGEMTATERCPLRPSARWCAGPASLTDMYRSDEGDDPDA